MPDKGLIISPPNVMSWAEYLQSTAFIDHIIIIICIFVLLLAMSVFLLILYRDSIPASKMDAFLQAWHEQQKFEQDEKKRKERVDQVRQQQAEMNQAREKHWQKRQNVNINHNTAKASVRDREK